MPGQQLRLKHGKQSKRSVLANESVLKLFAFSFLPRGENRLSTVILQQHSTIVCNQKVALDHLFPVDQRQNQSVSQNRTKLLHQIKSHARPPRSVSMKESNSRIKTNCFQCATAIVRKQNIQE